MSRVYLSEADSTNTLNAITSRVLANAIQMMDQQRTRKYKAPRRDTTLSRIERLVVVLPQMTGYELALAACRHYNNRQDSYINRQVRRGRAVEDIEFHEAVPQSAPNFLQRICVNYLRHQCAY